MKKETASYITIETTINAPVKQVWEVWNDPVHIANWCFATPEWSAPYAENDLKVGGKFKTTMAARDGSFSFDLCGIYTAVIDQKELIYRFDDDRTVKVTFLTEGYQTKIIQIFEAEKNNPIEIQKAGWQAILNNFKAYAERR